MPDKSSRRPEGVVGSPRGPLRRKPRLLSGAGSKVCDVDAKVEYPGLVWVKDPVDASGAPTGQPPRRRHHEACWHFYRAEDGSQLGPAPYRATEEQMRTLPACQTCAETMPGNAGARQVAAGGRRGELCPSCFIERPLVGPCPSCGEE